MASITDSTKTIDLYGHYGNYPDFLAINKVWVCEKSVDVLVNTDRNKYYLLHFEPGNYSYTFGQEYGFGTVCYKNKTGAVLNPFLLDLLKTNRTGYARYKTKSIHSWNLFAHLTPDTCALWFSRQYTTSITISK